MVRKIITPSDTTITLHLPKEMIGKRVELLAFEIEEEQKKSMSKEDFLRKIDELTRESRVDLSGFKFDRDEANNYDE